MKRVLLFLKSLLPTRLPVGKAEFDQWQRDILSLSGVPANESTLFAIAVMVLHLDPTVDRKPMHYFVKALNKGAANEVANSIILDLKAKQKERMEQEAKDKGIGSTPKQGAPNEVLQNGKV